MILSLFSNVTSVGLLSDRVWVGYQFRFGRTKINKPSSSPIAEKTSLLAFLEKKYNWCSAINFIS